MRLEFGIVAALFAVVPLAAQDRPAWPDTFSVTLLWAPLPDGWERAAAAPRETTNRPLDVPAAIFEHRAVLYTHQHRPFSEVRERYQCEALAFSLPSAARR